MLPGAFETHAQSVSLLSHLDFPECCECTNWDMAEYRAAEVSGNILTNVHLSTAGPEKQQHEGPALYSSRVTPFNNVI